MRAEENDDESDHLLTRDRDGRARTAAARRDAGDEMVARTPPKRIVAANVVRFSLPSRARLFSPVDTPVVQGREPMAARVRSDVVSATRTGFGCTGFGSAAFDRFAKAPPAWEVLPRGRETLDELAASWRLPPLGYAKLVEVLSSDPVSYVRPTPRSVAVRFPSAKMARVIQAASRTVEFAFVHYCEYDPGVLFYVDQPLTTRIDIINRAGHPQNVAYTCDYLVGRGDGVYAYECKPLSWLQEQSQKPNPRYVYDDSSGTWGHPAAEKAFREFGFSYRVFHSGEVNSRWLRNVRFLADFLSIDPPDGVDKALAAIREAQSMSFFEARGVPGATREAWFWLMASGQVAVDLEREVIDRPDLLDLASVHQSHAALVCHRAVMDSRDHRGVVPSLRNAVLCLDPGVGVVFRDVQYHVVSRDTEQVVLCRADVSCEAASEPPVVIPVDSVSTLVDSGHLRAVVPMPDDLIAQHSRRFLGCATEAERRRALRRWTSLCHYRLDGTLPAGVCRRSVFNYQNRAREGAERYGSEFLGMFRPARGPGAGSSELGCSGGRPLPALDRALLQEVAAAFHRGKYASCVTSGGVEMPVPSRRRVSAAYSDYVRLADERGLKKRPRRTLAREIEKYSIETSERNRRGARAAYRYSPPVVLLANVIPVHGARVFEVGHVDHQLLDVLCVSGATGALLGRPWVTPIVDGFSRLPLGYTVGFDPPCAWSVLCAMYDCIARQGRFVDMLVSDQGIEFDSPDLDLALAYCRTAHVRRPPSKPRYGAYIERYFGSLKTRLIDELRGSVDTVARSRELSATHDPKRHAVWTLPALSRLLDRYFFYTYPQLIHRELGAEHRRVFEFSNEHAGERVARHIAVDDTLSLALSRTVPGPKGTRKVPKGGGPISVRCLPFRHPEFSDERVRGRSIPVRHSPADSSFVFVMLPHRGQWERARLVSGSIDLTQCSWAQARALIEEASCQRLLGSLGSVEETNAMVMADLLLSVDEYERKALERRRDIDDEQAFESRLRLLEVGEVAPPLKVSGPPASSDSGGADVPPLSFDLPEPRSYDEFSDGFV